MYPFCFPKGNTKLQPGYADCVANEGEPHDYYPAEVRKIAIKDLKLDVVLVAISERSYRQHNSIVTNLWLNGAQLINEQELYLRFYNHDDYADFNAILQSKFVRSGQQDHLYHANWNVSYQSRARALKFLTPVRIFKNHGYCCYETHDCHGVNQKTQSSLFQVYFTKFL